MVTANCHPEKRHEAHGLCNGCYKRWLKAQPGYSRSDQPRSPAGEARRIERRRARRAEGYIPPKRIQLNRDPRDRMRNRLKAYGLTPDQFEAMLVAQHNRCAICGRAEYGTWHGKVRHLAIDHHHESGRVRALLCTGCNLGLGAFGDDAERLRLAADYLERMAGR